MPLKMKITKAFKNKVFVIQCLEDIEQLVPSQDSYGNTVFHMDAKLIKGRLVSGKDKQYVVEQGDNFTYEFSNALYNKIKSENIEGKAKLGIEMSVQGDSTQWLVSDMDDETELPWMGEFASDGKTSETSKTDETSQLNTSQGMNYGYKDVKHRDDSRSLDIKWGMSFNKAVELVIAEHGDTKFFEDKEEVQVAIRNMTHRLMDIATGIDIWIKEKQSEEAFEHSIDDEKF